MHVTPSAFQVATQALCIAHVCAKLTFSTPLLQEHALAHAAALFEEGDVNKARVLSGQEVLALLVKGSTLHRLHTHLTEPQIAAQQSALCSTLELTPCGFRMVWLQSKDAQVGSLDADASGMHPPALHVLPACTVQHCSPCLP